MCLKSERRPQTSFRHSQAKYGPTSVSRTSGSFLNQRQGWGPGRSGQEPSSWLLPFLPRPVCPRFSVDRRSRPVPRASPRLRRVSATRVTTGSNESGVTRERRPPPLLPSPLSLSPSGRLALRTNSPRLGFPFRLSSLPPPGTLPSLGQPDPTRMLLHPCVSHQGCDPLKFGRSTVFTAGAAPLVRPPLWPPTWLASVELPPR